MFKITFDFNNKTKKVYNVKVIEVEDNDQDIGFIEIKDNKLILSPKACELINANDGDRVSINYIIVDNTTTLPLIAKSDNFADKESGNKLTKSRTVSFKGNQKEILLQYGSKFKLTNYKSEIFRLESTIDEDELKSEKENLKEIETVIDNLNELEF